MTDYPDFGNYIDWSKVVDREFNLNVWLLKRLPYQVDLYHKYACPDLRDIGKFVEGQWSAYAAADGTTISCYFFELESDAMAFKLRWI